MDDVTSRPYEEGSRKDLADAIRLARPSSEAP